MATEVDKLLIRIEADLSSVRRQLNTLDRQVQQKLVLFLKILTELQALQKLL